MEWWGFEYKTSSTLTALRKKLNKQKFPPALEEEKSTHPPKLSPLRNKTEAKSMISSHIV
jgi:hypothetical protein